MRILIAEQDQTLNAILEAELSEEGYDLIFVSDSTEAFRVVQTREPDCIIMDWTIPITGGMRVCRKIRTEPEIAETPIIMVGSDNLADKIKALETGADEYLGKPFDMEELVTRIKALQRRGGSAHHKIIRAGSLELDPQRWIVLVSGYPVSLTTIEFRLLQELLEAKGRVLSRQHLLEQVWGYHRDLDVNTRTVDVHVGRLRRKLAEAGNMILTIRNIGYRIDIAIEWITRRPSY